MRQGRMCKRAPAACSGHTGWICAHWHGRQLSTIFRQLLQVNVFSEMIVRTAQKPVTQFVIN